MNRIFFRSSSVILELLMILSIAYLAAQKCYDLNVKERIWNETKHLCGFDRYCSTRCWRSNCRKKESNFKLELGVSLRPARFYCLNSRDVSHAKTVVNSHDSTQRMEFNSKMRKKNARASSTKTDKPNPKTKKTVSTVCAARTRMRENN